MLKKEYIREQRKKIMLIWGLILMTLVLAYICTTIGMKSASVWQMMVALKKAWDGTINQGSDIAVNKIILLLRMPRVVLAILAGIGLSLAGAVMQSITRNYLVSPFTLGISSSAAFGASVCIVFGSNSFFKSDMGVIISAFAFSFSCGCIVYGVSRQIGLKPDMIVLVGIALNYLFSAMTAMIEFFAKEYKLEAVVQWSFGSLNKATWEINVFIAVVILVCFSVLIRYCLELNAMASNDDEMLKSLGVHPERVRMVTGLLAVFMTSTIISFTGVIGFVGLIAPHMSRLIIGYDHQYYLPFTSALGAFLLLLSDTVGRFILYPVHIPVGVIISFLGVPLFIHLIFSRGKKFQ